MEILEIILWIWILFLILLVVRNVQLQKSKKEEFIPKIRSYYRPYLRNARIYAESFSNTYNNDYFVRIMHRLGLY